MTMGEFGSVLLTNVVSRRRLDLDLLGSLVLLIFLKSRRTISVQWNAWDVAISEEHSFFEEEKTARSKTHPIANSTQKKRL
jgi:hypothetical protein